MEIVLLPLGDNDPQTRQQQGVFAVQYIDWLLLGSAALAVGHGNPFWKKSAETAFT